MVRSSHTGQRRCGDVQINSHYDLALYALIPIINGTSHGGSLKCLPQDYCVVWGDCGTGLMVFMKWSIGEESKQGLKYLMVWHNRVKSVGNGS